MDLAGVVQREVTMDSSRGCPGRGDHGLSWGCPRTGNTTDSTGFFQEQVNMDLAEVFQEKKMTTSMNQEKAQGSSQLGEPIVSPTNN